MLVRYAVHKSVDGAVNIKAGSTVGELRKCLRRKRLDPTGDLLILRIVNGAMEQLSDPADSTVIRDLDTVLFSQDEVRDAQTAFQRFLDEVQDREEHPADSRRRINSLKDLEDLMMELPEEAEIELGSSVFEFPDIKSGKDPKESGNDRQSAAGGKDAGERFSQLLSIF